MVMQAYQPAEDIGNLPRQAIVRIPTVLKVFPVSRSTWVNGVKDGRYPKPVKVSERGVGWRWGDILDMLDGEAGNG